MNRAFACRILQCAALCLAAMFAPLTSHAQDYPSRPVKIVVPGAAGDASDIIARLVAQKLTERIGQQFVVENRAGAGGIVGSEAVAKSPADGYTLILAHAGSHGINAAVYSNLPYDPQRDFTPISLVAKAPNIFVVNPDVPARNVQEFIAYAKTVPGKLNFASGGRGTSAHLSAELLNSMAGLKLVHVPYKGATPAITDVIAGHAQLFIGNMPPTLPHIQSGKLRALAVTSTNRWPDLPDVPTMAESGLPGYETVAWFALLAPAGLPAPIAQRLSSETAAAMKTPEVRAQLRKQGMEAIGSTGPELASFIATDIARWKKVAAESGTKLD